MQLYWACICHGVTEMVACWVNVIKGVKAVSTPLQGSMVILVQSAIATCELTNQKQEQ